MTGSGPGLPLAGYAIRPRGYLIVHPDCSIDKVKDNSLYEAHVSLQKGLNLLEP